MIVLAQKILRAGLLSEDLDRWVSLYCSICDQCFGSISERILKDSFLVLLEIGLSEQKLHSMSKLCGEQLEVAKLELRESRQMVLQRLCHMIRNYVRMGNGGPGARGTFIQVFSDFVCSQAVLQAPSPNVLINAYELLLLFTDEFDCTDLLQSRWINAGSFWSYTNGKHLDTWDLRRFDATAEEYEQFLQTKEVSEGWGCWSFFFSMFCLHVGPLRIIKNSNFEQNIILWDQLQQERTLQLLTIAALWLQRETPATIRLLPAWVPETLLDYLHFLAVNNSPLFEKFEIVDPFELKPRVCKPYPYRFAEIDVRKLILKLRDFAIEFVDPARGLRSPLLRSKLFRFFTDQPRLKGIFLSKLPVDFPLNLLEI